MKHFAPPLSRHRFGWVDAVVIIFVFVLLYAILTLGAGMKAPLALGDPGGIDLAPAMLPYYAGRSLLRMFIAFAASLLFSLGYGYIAAKNHTAEIFLVPLLDMLQSIPVLGFLSATIAAFIAFFPGSLLGVEIASIFAIFTGQAWNMTFSFYHSLKIIPKELQEAASAAQCLATLLAVGSAVFRHWPSLERHDVLWRRLVFFGCQRSDYRVGSRYQVAGRGVVSGLSD